MAADVVAALTGCAAIERIIAVYGGTPPPLRSSKLELLRDSRRSGQSTAVAAGLARAKEAGFERVLCVPGDCPALAVGELEALLAEERRPQAVVVPDRHGEGTNGLLLSPPDLLRPAFGPGSLARHLAAARQAGVEPRIARPQTLLLDVDTPADLLALISNRRLLSSRSATRRWLAANHRLASKLRADVG